MKVIAVRCGKAKHLIALRPDGDLREREAQALALHLAACESCRRCAQRMNATDRMLQDDARELGALTPSPAFRNRLHQALCLEQAAREQRPSARMQRALDSAFRRAPSVSRMAVPCAALAAALAAGFTLSLAAVTAPPSTGTEVEVRRIASMTLRPTDDGRVYATLTARIALGGSGLRDVYLR